MRCHSCLKWKNVKECPLSMWLEDKKDRTSQRHAKGNDYCVWYEKC